MKQSFSRLAAAALALSPVAFGTALPHRAAAQQGHEHPVREIQIIVDGAYTPSRIELREGDHVRLKFLRKSAQDCAGEVVFPQLKLRRELPPGKLVIVDLPTLRAGEYEFTCGMKMIKGVLVVRAAT